MRWGPNLRLSARALIRAPGRTALSATGVAIGIAAVVLLLGAGAGAERAIRATLQDLGRNLLLLTPAQVSADALRGASRLRETLTPADAAAIEGEVPGVVRVAPVSGGMSLARRGSRMLSVTLVGTTPSFQALRSFPLAAGRFLQEEDVAARRRVVVINAMIVREMFDGEIPLGEWLFVDGVPFRIIGVTRKKGVSLEGSNEDELIFVPLTTAMRRLRNVDALSSVYIQADSEEAVAGVLAGTQRLLRERHGIPAGADDDFDLQDQTATVRAQQEAGRTLSPVVTGLVVVALGLGGVGLLAASLLSVRERYPEIGLRLAVGGRPRDILLQFLAETVMLSLLGGLAGVLLGGIGVRIGRSLTAWPMVLSWQAATLPLGISVVIAVVSGAYPALRAARLDPVKTLQDR